ncbi:MAG: cyclic nucleotide-binding domain-containing protein [Nostocaceae cyanobacterium]|nr:cyclic nucleotide-binding domain-containing protein [Nostocaceae cyanobacterium]
MTDLKDALRQVPLFNHILEGRLQWLIEQGTEVWLEPGETHREQGSLADAVFILIDGELRVVQKTGNQEVILATYKSKTLFGELPTLLGDTHFWATGLAVTRCRIFEFSNQVFWELMTSCSCVMTTILRTMAERLQELQSMSQQREKLASLGTLAAGLAHELNNPASASSRAVGQLRQTVQILQPLTVKLNQEQMTSAQKGFLANLQQSALVRAKTAIKLDALTQSDREEEFTDWLDKYQIINAWKLAPTLVTAGCDIDWLENVHSHVGASLGDVLTWMEMTLQEFELLEELEHSTTRISTLVQAVKDYSYMDQAPIQDIDIHQGLESTLVMLGYKLKQANVVVNREYDCDIPRLSAYGSELNQVWTHLIDNAIDALGFVHTPTIGIRTSCESNFLVVEIADNGVGIPPEVQSHIFEPFFTTKGVGQGTGLGLHIAYRIVVGEHQGDIRVYSQSGDTKLQVLLPLKLS